MKRLLPLSLLTLAMMLSGCAWVGRHTPWHHHADAAQTAKADATPKAVKPSKAAKAAPNASTAAQPQSIVTPDDSLAAKVLRVNDVGRFVVLNFPTGRLPGLDQHMFLYRNGLKSAEVKIVGPQQDTSIVADIISGNAQVGDTVRDQ